MSETTASAGTKRLRTSYFSVVLSVSLVLFILGLLGILVIDARKLSDYVKEHVQLTVFLQDGASEPEVAALQELIEGAAFTKSVRYVSKEAALDSLRKDLGDDALGMLESNPLPASLDINVKAEYAGADSLKKIKEALSVNEQLVSEVSYKESEVEQISRNSRSLALALLIFSGLLLLIAVALINNTMRLSLYSSRFMIKSMQLVGATRGFIRGPFLKRSFLHGMLSGLIACGLLMIMLLLISNRFPEIGQLSDLRSVVLLFCGIVGLGVLISAISTYFAVNKYLSSRSGELY
ncbi:MAG: Cell division protein FtsX [Bacteroidota bacterium]|jgi:cell division transport system permease protein